MKNYIITIARGFGSGGKEIGTKLAHRLGIPCYEEQILTMASEASGLNESLFHQVDEKMKGPALVKRLLTIPFPDAVKPQDSRFESDINLYNLQVNIIKELAKNTSCIIIGKCADYVLREYPAVASFYIEAPRADCVESIVKKMGISESEAHKLIHKTDKYRADYYKYYTGGNDWTNPTNYDMTLNSAKIGREECVNMLEYYVRRKFKLVGK